MKVYFSTFCFFVLSLLVTAQVSIPGDPFGDIDKLRDTTALSLYTSIEREQVEGFHIIDPMVKASVNTVYARGFNDGAVWKGKGVTMEAHGGFSGKKGKLSFTFFPIVYSSQNAGFDLAPQASNRNEFGYQFSSQIDWVQRYGNSSFVQFHPGQSEIKLTLNKFEIAASTQNYSLGPSNYNPILLSRQAGGFPHARLGLKPTNVKAGKVDFGKLEGNLLFGLLGESEYYDNDSDNDNRYFTGLTLAYTPSFLPELTLGFNKVLYKQTRFFEATDLISTLFIVDDGVINGDTLSPNDAFDQMASVTLEWKIKEVRFRAYGEFAKNDFTGGSAGFRFFITEPEHTRAYTVGLEKEIITKKGNSIRINYEHTNLSRNHGHQWRPTPSYYAHNINRQGYTHNGQIVGAGIGTGGNSDHLSVRLLKSDIGYGVLLQRIENNRDFFVVNISDANRHDIEYTASSFLQKETPKFILMAELGISRNYNRYYRFMSDKANIFLSLGTRIKMP